MMLASPVVAEPQVVTILNEVEVEGALVPILPFSPPQIVGDGRYVAFTGPSPADSRTILWIKDVTAPRGVIQQTNLELNSGFAASPDARYIAFVSDNEGIVQDKTNLCWHPIGRNSYAEKPCFDLFVRDLVSGSVRRIHGPEQHQIAADAGAPQFSADGRWIVYSRALASNPESQPLQVLLHDVERGVTTLISGSLFAHSPSVSRDATRVAFIGILDAGTASAKNAVMVYDRTTGVTERADVETGIVDAVGFSVVISGNGRYVAFNGFCRSCPALSNDRVVMRDLLWKRTWRPIVGVDGAEPNFGADLRGLSEDGRFILLESPSTNLVSGVRLGNIFFYDRVTNTATHVSQGLLGQQPDGVSFGPSMDTLTGRIAFESQARTIAPYATNSLGNFIYLASLDLDNDGLHDSWERFFDESPLLTGPAFDDDGDGLSNLNEFKSGTHPRGRFGLSFRTPAESDAWGIKLHNQTGRTARVVFRLIDGSGNTATQAIQLPPLSSTPIRLTALPDRPPTEFTLEVESDEPLFGFSRFGRQ